MADIRTLKLALLAETTDFIKGLDKANKEAEDFSTRLDKGLAVAGKAFLGLASAAGTAAFAIGVTSVNAAIEAQREDALLEKSINNLTGATVEQTKAVMDYLDAAENAAGINSDQLKPSFERILRSVKDITKATEIQKVAQDVAAGTGKSLTEVSDSLARAYEGNVKGLKDLGIELQTTVTRTRKVKVSKDDLTKAELSSKSASLGLQSAQERLNKVLNNSKSDALDVAQAQNALERAQLRAGDASDIFEKKQKNVGKSISETKEVARPFADILADLSKQFEGSAAAAADTLAGRMEILKTSIGKVQEEVGFALLPFFEKMIKFIEGDMLPVIKRFVEGLTGKGKQSLTTAFYDVGTGTVTFGYKMDTAKGQAYLLGEQLFILANKFVELGNKALGAAEGEGLKKLLETFNNIASAIKNTVDAYQSFKESFIGGALLDASNLVNPAVIGGRLAVGGPSNLIKAPNTTNYVINNFKGPVDQQSFARQTTKSLTTATKTTGIKPFIPNR
jgi:hypothetical protein